jgi:hypothetical protein
MEDIVINKRIRTSPCKESIGTWKGIPVFVRRMTHEYLISCEVEILKIVGPHINCTQPLFTHLYPPMNGWSGPLFDYNVIVYPYDPQRVKLRDIIYDAGSYSTDNFCDIIKELSNMINIVHSLGIVHLNIDIDSVYVSFKCESLKEREVDKVWLEGWSWAFTIDGRYPALDPWGRKVSDPVGCEADTFDLYRLIGLIRRYVLNESAKK